MHTYPYPYHNAHYNLQFWGVPEEEENLSDIEKIDAAMLRAKEFTMSQYASVSGYTKSIGID